MLGAVIENLKLAFDINNKKKTVSKLDLKNYNAYILNKIKDNKKN
jgi:hypothetical protein